MVTTLYIKKYDATSFLKNFNSDSELSCKIFMEKANSISRFISLQKKLRHVILSERYRYMRNCLDYNYNIVLNSLSTQCESLQNLDFTNLSFSKINEEVLSSLCSLKNIRELK